jgi:hypothetical protein
MHDWYILGCFLEALSSSITGTWFMDDGCNILIVVHLVEVWCMVDALAMVQVVIHVWCIIDALIDGIWYMIDG